MLENSFQFSSWEENECGKHLLLEAVTEKQIVYGPSVACSLLICFFPFSQGIKIEGRSHFA